MLALSSRPRVMARARVPFWMPVSTAMVIFCARGQSGGPTGAEAEGQCCKVEGDGGRAGRSELVREVFLP